MFLVIGLKNSYTWKGKSMSAPYEIDEGGGEASFFSAHN